MLNVRRTHTQTNSELLPPSCILSIIHPFNISTGNIYQETWLHRCEPSRQNAWTLLAVMLCFNDRQLKSVRKGRRRLSVSQFSVLMGDHHSICTHTRNKSHVSRMMQMFFVSCLSFIYSISHTFSFPITACREIYIYMYSYFSLTVEKGTNRHIQIKIHVVESLGVMKCSYTRSKITRNILWQNSKNVS